MTLPATGGLPRQHGEERVRYLLFFVVFFFICSSRFRFVSRRVFLITMSVDRVDNPVGGRA